MNHRFHTIMPTTQPTLTKMPSMLQAILVMLFIMGAAAGPVAWTEVPSIRTGQIESVTNLMTADDISTNITDISAVYINAITGAADVDLKTGVSLISYESWMTDTFSFNVTVVTKNSTGITVRFNVLDNTFFSKAKVHYIVVWRTNSIDNHALAANHTHDLDVIYGCYLTTSLLVGTGLRNQVVGNISTDIVNSPTTVVKSFISGMQLSNSVGKNDYVKIETQYSTIAPLQQLLHTITVENNNYLTFSCITTVIFDSSFSTTSGYSIIQSMTYILNATNSGLLPVPYMERYDGLSRMFFGISQFNLSMSDTRYLNVETANISLVSLLYDKNNAMNQITYNMFFFAKRVCSVLTEYYNPNTYLCVAACPTTSIATAAFLLCTPCHYSCTTCTVGLSATGCSGPCSVLKNRITAANGAGQCLCAVGFVDVGVAKCDPCSNTLVGCFDCSSTTVCLNCVNSTYIKDATNTKCICAGTTYMASSFCLPYPGCLTARYFLNNITCDVCDTAKNYVKLNNFTCACNLGFILNTLTLVCQDHCGDNITAFGKCDDGGLTPGDGCDQFCNVESGYHCGYTLNATGWPGISTCALKQQITIKYLYAERIITSNHFIMAFSLTPAQTGLSTTSFEGNFNSSMPITNQKITFDPVTSTIYLEGQYMESIEGTRQKITVTFNNMSFYADQRDVAFNAVGVNAQLVIEDHATLNSILRYIVMAIGLISLVLSIFSSIVGLKMVGIELLIPIQIIYFSLATIPNHTTYTFILSDLKYANGYNILQTYNYYRTHTQHKNLVGINYETQFLLSTNIMLGIFLFVLFWLLIHHFRLKYKEYVLEKYLETNAVAPPAEGIENKSQDSQEEKDDGEQGELDEEKVKLAKRKRRGKANEGQEEEFRLRDDHHRSFKIFTFEVDRIYFIFLLILVNQMMFGFVIMTLNVPIGTFYFPEEMNVLVCNFLFFIFIGNMVFISYDQESNKMIAFTCIKDRYAYIYLLINFIIITTLSMTFQQSFSTYLVTVMSFSFLVLIFKERPYSSVLFTFENVVALYNHFMLAICLIMLCIIRAETNAKQQTQLIETYIIVALLLIGEILTTIRIISKVNFKKAFDDLKNPNEEDDSDKKKKKVIEKNFDLLQEDKKVEIIPPDSVRNGLLTPKNNMVDWESRNTDEYESMKHKDKEAENHQTGTGDEGNKNPQPDQEEQPSENKEEKLNELQILKKRLRNNLKLKKEADAKKDK